MKNVMNSVKSIVMFVVLGLFVAKCSKTDTSFSRHKENLKAKETVSLTDEDIQKIANLHNEYLAEMISWGVHDEESLIDYLQENFEGFNSVSRDSIHTLLNELRNITKEDLNNLILQNKKEFNDANLLVNYLDQADQYLDNFDEQFLINLEQQARTELAGIDWQVFYTYISVMKKSKEFWVDLGNLDDLNSNVQAKKVVAEDAKGAVGGLLAFFLSAGVTAVTGMVLIPLTAGGFFASIAINAAAG